MSWCGWMFVLFGVVVMYAARQYIMRICERRGAVQYGWSDASATAAADATAAVATAADAHIEDSRGFRLFSVCLLSHCNGNLQGPILWSLSMHIQCPNSCIPMYIITIH